MNDYTQLQSDVIAYTHRNDLAGNVAGFISLAESFLFRELRIKEIEISVAVTTTSEYAALPTDFGDVTRLTITKNGLTSTLDYATEFDLSTSSNDRPTKYKLENNSLRVFGSGDGEALTLYYTPKIQNLDALVPTNWLLDNAYDLYLQASLAEAFRFTRNDAELAKSEGKIPMLLDSARRFSERRGQPSSGSLQIKVRRG